ncbi:MAG: universal stress protein [Thermodesulfovibrionales bacterium]|nr:universal stress protein [Thermodesulfovibrionales bacterium]
MKKVLVATDGSDESMKAIDRAVKIAKSSDTEVVVVNVAEDFCPVGLVEVDCDTIRELVLKESKGIMQTAVSKLKEAGIKNIKEVIEFGSPAETIVEVADREKVDEIIVASRGRHGVKKLLMGSVAARVLEWAKCPVVVVK